MKYQRWLSGPDIHGKGRFYFIKYENFMVLDTGIYILSGGITYKRKELVIHFGWFSLIIDLSPKEPINL